MKKVYTGGTRMSQSPKSTKKTSPKPMKPSGKTGSGRKMC